MEYALARARHTFAIERIPDGDSNSFKMMTQFFTRHEMVTHKNRWNERI